MAQPTVVDAVKTEAPNAQHVTVPLRVDASALSKALQAAVPREAQVNAGELIKKSAQKMAELYRRFDELRLLTAELHGKALTDPLPSTVQLEDVSIRFRITKDGKASELITATLQTVVCVGDITPLLTSEIGLIALQLEQEAAAVKKIATLAEDTSAKARASWETQNPDRKFTVTTTDKPELTQTNDAPSV